MLIHTGSQYSSSDGHFQHVYRNSENVNDCRGKEKKGKKKKKRRHGSQHSSKI
jgi:hypothetical protein